MGHMPAASLEMPHMQAPFPSQSSPSIGQSSVPATIGVQPPGPSIVHTGQTFPELLEAAEELLETVAPPAPPVPDDVPDDALDEVNTSPELLLDEEAEVVDELDEMLGTVPDSSRPHDATRAIPNVIEIKQRNVVVEVGKLFISGAYRNFHVCVTKKTPENAGISLCQQPLGSHDPFG